MFILSDRVHFFLIFHNKVTRPNEQSTKTIGGGSWRKSRPSVQYIPYRNRFVKRQLFFRVCARSTAAVSSALKLISLRVERVWVLCVCMKFVGNEIGSAKSPTLVFNVIASLSPPIFLSRAPPLPPPPHPVSLHLSLSLSPPHFFRNFVLFFALL